MLQAESSPVLLRSLGIWLLVTCSYGFIGLLCVGAAANSDVPIAGRIVCAAIAAALVALAVWTFRAGILLQTDGLTVRRYGGRDVQVEWANVLEAAIVPNGKGGGFVAVFTKDGRVLKTQGLAVNSLGSAWGQHVVTTINERLTPAH